MNKRFTEEKYQTLFRVTHLQKYKGRQDNDLLPIKSGKVYSLQCSGHIADDQKYLITGNANFKLAEF